MKNGRQISGIIIEDTGSKVVIDTGVQEVQIPFDQISKIEKSDEVENKLSKIQSLAENGNLKDVFVLYNEIMDAAEKENIASEKIYGKIYESYIQNSELILEKIKNADITKVSPLMQKFSILLNNSRDLSNDSKDEINYSLMLIWLSTNDIDNAVKSFMNIKSDINNIPEEKKRVISKVLKEKIRSQISKNDYESAIIYIENLNKINKKIGNNAEILFYLDWAGKLRKSGKYKESIEVYIKKLKPLSPYIADERIKSTFVLLSHEALEKKDYTQAIDLWTTYGVKLRPDLVKDYLPELNLNYGKQLFEHGKYEDAKIVFRNVFGTEFETAAKKSIAACEYKMAAEKIEKDNPDAHYRLGEYCVKQELFNEAIEEFKIASSSEKLKENSILQIGVISEKMQIEQLKKAMSLYEKEKYFQTLDVVYEFLKKFPDSPSRQDAEKLKNLCKKSINAQNYEAAYQADIYFQEAERAFYLGDFKSAMEKCIVINKEYPDTQAAKNTKFLMPQIKNLQNFNFIETSQYSSAKFDDNTTEAIRLSAEYEKIENEMKDILNTYYSDNE